MATATPARQAEIENSCYWLRQQGASEDTIDMALSLGRAWRLLPDEAVMVLVNEIVGRAQRPIEAIIEAHVLSRAV